MWVRRLGCCCRMLSTCLDMRHPMITIAPSTAGTLQQRNPSVAVFVRRVAVLQQLLTKGYDVIVSDADVVWLKNPFASLASGESDFQLTVDSDVAEDGTQKPCTGIMLVKASEPSRSGTFWLAACAILECLQYSHRCQLYCTWKIEQSNLQLQPLC